MRIRRRIGDPPYQAVAESTAGPNITLPEYIPVLDELARMVLEMPEAQQTTLSQAPDKTRKERAFDQSMIDAMVRRREAIERGVNPNLAFMAPAGLMGDSRDIATYMYDNPETSGISMVSNAMAGIPEAVALDFALPVVLRDMAPYAAAFGRGLRKGSKVADDVIDIPFEYVDDAAEALSPMKAVKAGPVRELTTAPVVRSSPALDKLVASSGKKGVSVKAIQQQAQSGSISDAERAHLMALVTAANAAQSTHIPANLVQSGGLKEVGMYVDDDPDYNPYNPDEIENIEVIDNEIMAEEAFSRTWGVGNLLRDNPRYEGMLPTPAGNLGRSTAPAPMSVLDPSLRLAEAVQEEARVIRLRGETSRYGEDGKHFTTGEEPDKVTGELISLEETGVSSHIRYTLDPQEAFKKHMGEPYRNVLSMLEIQSDAQQNHSPGMQKLKFDDWEVNNPKFNPLSTDVSVARGMAKAQKQLASGDKDEAAMTMRDINRYVRAAQVRTKKVNGYLKQRMAEHLAAGKEDRFVEDIGFRYDHEQLSDNSTIVQFLRDGLESDAITLSDISTWSASTFEFDLHIGVQSAPRTGRLVAEEELFDRLRKVDYYTLVDEINASFIERGMGRLTPVVPTDDRGELQWNTRKLYDTLGKYFDYTEKRIDIKEDQYDKLLARPTTGTSLPTSKTWVRESLSHFIEKAKLANAEAIRIPTVETAAKIQAHTLKGMPQPIRTRYQDLPKDLKALGIDKASMKNVTDEAGHTWIEIPVSAIPQKLKVFKDGGRFVIHKS